MIVSNNDGSTLELFWRHPVSRHPSRSSAESFLFGLPGRREVVHALRALPVQRWGPVLTCGEDALVKGVARGIACREVTVLQHRSEIRWSGRQLATPTLPTSIFLLYRDENESARDVSKCLEWIETLGEGELQLLAKGVWNRYGQGTRAGLSPHELLSDLRRLVGLGEIVPLFHGSPAGHSATARPSPAASSPAPARGPAPAAAVVEDSPTFAADHSTAAQVEAMIAAARSGVPFCEVCAREAARRAS